MIERRKIRGETSNGMLCSARELGLGTDHDGILALAVERCCRGRRSSPLCPIGDTRLVIDVSPNRADLLSHEGVAREICGGHGSLAAPANDRWNGTVDDTVCRAMNDAV